MFPFIVEGSPGGVIHTATCKGFRCRAWAMYFCYYCFVFVCPQGSLPCTFFAVLHVRPGIRTAMGPSSSLLHVDIEELADFFAFLQCSLRMEAQELLGLELCLEDPRASEMWQHFVDWLG